MTRAPWVQAKPEKAFAGPGEIARHLDRLAVHQPALPEAARQGDLLDDRRPPRRSPTWTASPGTTRTPSRCASTSAPSRRIDAGRFAAEIVGRADRGTASVTADEGPRRDTSARGARRAAPGRRAGGVVTAGNSSRRSTTAPRRSSWPAARRSSGYGLTPRARIVGGASAGVAPEIMGLGPVPATEKLLAAPEARRRPTWTRSSSTRRSPPSRWPCIRRLGLDPDVVNADGGAIALGHPLGASGARILVTLLGRMEREDARRGLATHVRRRRAGRSARGGGGLMTGRRSFVEERPDRWHVTPEPARGAQRDRPADGRRAARAVRRAGGRTAHPDPHRGRRRLRLRAPTSASCASGAAPTRCAGINTHAFIAHRAHCRCRSSPRSTATRSAAAPSSPTRPTSASRTPRRKIGNPETGPRHHRRRRRARGGCPRSSAKPRGQASCCSTGRVLDADEALACGLVSARCTTADELLAAAHALADRIAANDPLATQLHQARAARAARRAPGRRPRAAGRAVREPREAARA